MRTLWIAIGLLGCGPRIDPGPSVAERARAPVRVVTSEVPEAPDLYLAAMVRAGSAFDPPGREGTAALALRAMVEAGAGERDSEAVRDALFPTGNGLQTVIDREWVSLRLRCHRDHAARCVELFADVLTRPRFDANDVIRLREDAAHAVSDGLLGDEEALAFEAFEALLYEGHPYGHPPTGRAGVVGTIGPAELAAFHAAHYVRDAMVVGIAGGFPAEARADLIDRLQALPTAPGPRLALMQPVPGPGRTLLALDTDTPVTGMVLGHPLAVGREHPDWPALLLATTALGAHRQSFGRLFRSLRAERGLNYGDYAYVEPHVERPTSSLPEQGVLRSQNRFAIWIRPTSLEDGPFALKLALHEVERWVESGLTREELDDVRAWMIGALAVGAADPGRRLAYALEAEVTGTPDLLRWLPGALEALTLEEVNAAIAAHVRPDDLRVVAVSGEAEALVARLLDPAPTPATAPRPDDEAIAARPIGLAPEHAWTAAADGFFR